MANTQLGPMGRRILLGVGANAVGKLWVLGIQLLSVPVLVTKWGASDYGIWLMLTAVPTYIALGDLGFGAAAAVDMTRRVALGDRDGALTAFQSVWLFISLISAVLLCSGGLAVALQEHFTLFSAIAPNVACAALLLLLYALVVLQMNLVNIAFRSVGRYAQGTFFLDILVPMEGAALLVTAFAGGHFTAAAAVMLTMRGAGYCLYYLMLRRAVPWVKVGWSHASLSEIRALAKPALAALSLPFSTALNIQGVLFVVGLAISPTAAAMFGTIRTITRVPLQLVGIFTRATMPEITVAYAQADKMRLDRLVASNLVAAALAAIPAVVVLSLAGNEVLTVLTRGHLGAPAGLFLMMSGLMVLQTFWNTIGSFLFSLNLQQRFTFIYATLSIVSTAVCYFAARQLGIEVMALILIVVDAIMAFVVIEAWCSVLEHNGLAPTSVRGILAKSVKYVLSACRFVSTERQS